MNPPQYPWNGTFKFTEVELEMIKRINYFLTRPLSPRWIYYSLYDIPDAKKQRQLNAILNKARKDKRQLIKRDLVTDDTRSPTIWTSNQNLAEFVSELSYYRDVWQDQPRYIEVWMEDQASLEAVKKSPRKLLQRRRTNARYCKGFNSIGAMWDAFKFFDEMDKPITILYYGDLNPSGWAIPIIIVRQFEEMGLDITLKRLALNADQLSEHGIQVYTKISGDPRRKEFNTLFGFGEWEEEPMQLYMDETTGKTKRGKRHLNIDLEKIPIDDLETRIESDLVDHLDMDTFMESLDTEREEDEELDRIKEEVMRGR